jgi:hypothetical protein
MFKPRIQGRSDDPETLKYSAHVMEESHEVDVYSLLNIVKKPPQCMMQSQRYDLNECASKSRWPLI